MAPIPKGGTVAVTGAAGFVGGWTVRLLLDKGYRVRACVRDANDPAKTTFLREMNGFASGRLTIHSANLDEAGCFDDIFAGCHGVAHIAHVSDYNDFDYVKNVCDHIVASIEKSGSVTRVVVTSSIAAVIMEADIYEFVRRPRPVRGPLSGRVESEADARARSRLLDEQDPRSEGVQRGGGEERPLGRDHVLPGRQRRSDPVGAPEGQGAPGSTTSSSCCSASARRTRPTGRG